MFIQMLPAVASLLLTAGPGDTSGTLLMAAKRGEGWPAIGPLTRVDVSPGAEPFHLLVEQPRPRHVPQDPDVTEAVLASGGGCVVDIPPSPRSRLVLRDLSGRRSERIFETPNLSGSSWSAATGKIAYGRTHSVQGSIHDAPFSYSEVHLLDVESGQDEVIGLGANPRLSKDGDWISFVLKRSLGVMRSDGSDRRLIGNGLRSLWSPKEPRILYWRAGGATRAAGEVRCLDLISGRDVEVAEGDALLVWGVQFSPDGTRVFMRRDGHIWSFAFADGILQQETRGSGELLLAPSPDGTRLAFFRIGGTVDQPLRLLDLNTREERPLFTDPHPGAPPGRFLWSPDSRFIAFNLAAQVIVQGADAELLLVDVEQGRLSRLIEPGGCGPWFTWQSSP